LAGRGAQQENLTITAAVKHPAFSLLDRQRLQTWQHKLYAEIESAADLLLALQSHERADKATQSRPTSTRNSCKAVEKWRENTNCEKTTR
jgi:hypothetical protein